MRGRREFVAEHDPRDSLGIIVGHFDDERLPFSSDHESPTAVAQADIRQNTRPRQSGRKKAVIGSIPGFSRRSGEHVLRVKINSFAVGLSRPIHLAIVRARLPRFHWRRGWGRSETSRLGC